MKQIKRRQFLKQSGSLALGLTIPGWHAGIGKNAMDNNIEAVVPLPIQIVIDDVGWWSGQDGSKQQQPYRTGIRRNHVPADYQAIVDLGRKLGVRPQAATILCEWDRENILKNLPTSTWMREKWDNSKWVGPWLDEAAGIITSNKDHYELTIHGVGHEYWADANFTRAEWADRTGRMRPLDQVELHLDYFNKLLEQNRLGSFPASFVPTAFLHGFGVTGQHEISMAGVLKQRGVTYINTPFYNMYNAEAVQYDLFGIDNGVITVDRGEDLFDWDVLAGMPAGELKGPTCGMHWPNLLHEDPQRNTEIVDGWVKFLKPYDDKPVSILAKDSRDFTNQLVHHVLTKTKTDGPFIDIDFRETVKINDQLSDNRLILKVVSPQRLEFISDDIKLSETKLFTDKNLNIYTLVLERMAGREKARIRFKA